AAPSARAAVGPSFRPRRPSLSFITVRRPSERSLTMSEAAKLPTETEKQAAPAPRTLWAPLENLRREIDRLFDDLHFGSWRMPFTRDDFKPELPWLRENGFALTPAVDLVEKETEYEISAELPGLEQKDVEVRLSNGTLIIKGEKREEKDERQKDYY